MYVSTLKLQPGICLKTLFALLLAASASACHCRNARTHPDKQRLIVTTDLGGTDPDDTQSMIHLLVCSNAIDIEGLVSSQVWSDMPDKVDRIREVVGQFEKVLPRLKKHAEGYPEPGYLRSVIRQGQKTSNMAGVGDGKASPGSELIIEAVDKKDDPRPVWIAAWGGMNTVAQALWTVTHTRSPKDIERFVRKIRIYDVLGQDDAGAWIAQNYPGILYLRNKAVYGWAPSDEWLRDNIQSHKPLGDYYPDRKWATEGDSPSFLHVYANGLNVPEEITFGGWGGRFSDIPVENIRGMKFIAQSGKDESLYDPYRMYACAAEGGNSIKRWEREIWNDFAARMAWTATDEYSAVNHHPVAIVDGHDDMSCIYKKVKAGRDMEFDASASYDPDGNPLDFRFKRKGFDDEEKGTLIFDYIWFIEKFRPVAFLIENVAGIMECDNDGRIKKALDDLASDGYTITEPRVLNAANYGVPQNRMRWIVAGTRKNTNIILPEPTATVTPCGSVFLRSTENAKNHVTRKHTAESICRYMKLPYGGRDKLGRVDRLDPRLPSKTVIAGGTKGGGRSHLHPFVPRTLSVRECARLQTFPDDYIFTGANARQFTQVGNAVPPLLAYKLALAIKHSVFLLPQKEELSTE